MTVSYRVNVDDRAKTQTYFTHSLTESLDEAKAVIPSIHRKYPTATVIIDRIVIETVHTDRGEGA